MECPSKSHGKNRYFTGMSSPVMFVAFMSAAVCVVIVSGAFVVAAIQGFFFVALPLGAAAAGAFLMASPKTNPFGEEPCAQLLVPAVGALMIAYAGGAMLVGASGCPRARSVHLGLMTAVFTSLAMACAGAEGVLSSQLLDSACMAFAKMALGAAVGAVSSAVAPAVTRRIRAGKPGSPADLMCGS